MPTIFEKVNATELGLYYNEMNMDRKPFLGETLFPNNKKLGLDLGWVKGSKGTPVALKSSAFDAKSKMRDRIGFSDMKTEMPFFKEAMLVKEKDRQELNKLQGNPNASEYVNRLLTNIFDDMTTLMEGGLVQVERMRMQLLSEGKVAISSVGLDGSEVAMDYDYNLADVQKAKVDWSQVDATPIDDILKWQDGVEDRTGTRPTRAITTRKVWGYLLSNEGIRGELKALNQGNVVISNSMLEMYLMDKLGLSIFINNKKYKSEAGVTKNYFKENTFTLIPEGTLGFTWFGTTPEESDLMAGSTNAEVSIVETGMAVTTTKETDPVNVKTKVSMIALPSFERADEVFIATVKPE